MKGTGYFGGGGHDKIHPLRNPVQRRALGIRYHIKMPPEGSSSLWREPEATKKIGFQGKDGPITPAPRETRMKRWAHGLSHSLGVLPPYADKTTTGGPPEAT